MGLAKKIDPFRDHQQEYAASEQPKLVTVERGQYLTITGRSEPGGPDFQGRVRALFHVAHAIEKAKRQGGHQFAVRALEALWWQGKSAEDGGTRWNWKLMLRVPEIVTDHDLATAKKSHHARDSLVTEVWLELIDEGQCVQLLHVGPFEREQQSLERLERFARDRGLQFEGFHHEIYLTNPTEVPPERLRTILRHSVIPSTVAARV